MLAQSPYHAQSSPNAPTTQPPQNTSTDQQQSSQQQQQQQQQAQQPQQGTIQTMRLRQDPPSVTQTQTRSRKRKSPPSTDALQPVPPPPPPAAMQHTLPPAHTLVPPPHLPGHVLPPSSYQYTPGAYSPGMLPPPHQLAPPPPTEEQRSQSQASNGTAGTNTTSSGTARTLSQSKRAEQNRKAQRAFRERRDQSVFIIPFFFFFHILIWACLYFHETGRHVKALESRSQLLDAALASADEANRRWEECRALVDQLRIENAALRAALSQSQMMGSGAPSVAPPSGGEERPAAAPVTESKSAEEPKE